MTHTEKDCYRLIQEIAILQDPVCVVCTERKSQAGHHLFTRSRHATAFHPEAARGLCNICHQEAHEEPQWFRQIMIEEIGDRFFELERLSRTVCKPDYGEVKKGLVETLNKLKEVNRCFF